MLSCTNKSSLGLDNAERDHTDLITNLWTQFKTDIISMRCIMQKNMQTFVSEFLFKRRFCKQKKEKDSNNLLLILKCFNN